MKKSVILTICLLLGVSVSTSFGVEVTVLGPNQYLRTTGAPDLYTDTFSAIPGEGRLIIKNGDEDGEHRISSAVVLINGEKLFGPNDFNQQVYHLEVPVNLTEDNTLSVELKSIPESYLNIEVKEEVEPPTVVISADPEEIHIGESSTLSWSSTNANSCVIEPGIGSVSVNGSISVSPNETATYTITATGLGGTATGNVTVTVAQIIHDEVKLTASDGAYVNYFGYSVSISGDYAIVGAYNDNDNGYGSGSAYIFKRQGDDWNETVKLTPSDGASGDNFGYSVSISGDYAIVGACWDDDRRINSGSAYIFKRQGDTWNEMAKLTASDGAYYDLFGYSVSISGDYAIVGAYWDDDKGVNSGSAYIFKRQGDTWNEMAKLTASDGAIEDHFSCSVSISGDYAIVGANGDDDNGSYSGSAYIFKRQGDTWKETAKLTASDGAFYDYFGSSVSISGDYAIVGADGDDDIGSAYIFKRQGDTWNEMAKLTASDGASSDYFGYSVSISGDYAIVGADGDDDNGSNSGSTYIFKREGNDWNETAKLTASDGAFYDYFGSSVSINGNYALVGAYGDDDNGSSSGSAYIYKIATGTDVPSVNINVDPETIQVGESSTLTWGSTNADSCIIEPGIGSVNVSGSTTVSPTETTTYTITAIGPGGTATDSVTVTVIHPPPTVSINADPETIQIGESSTLTWGSTNADSCIIEPGIGSVNVSGSTTVSPTETTTYTLTATGPGGMATDNVTVTVIHPSPTVSISADPATITIGESSTLTWTSTNANSCVIDNGIGSVPLNGSISVSPTGTTTYTITAKGAGGTATANVTVTVTYPQPTVSISADPETINMGNSSTLTWTSNYAQSCVIEPGIGNVDVTGSITVSPTETTTYIITATGPGGTATDSVTVTVTVIPLNISITSPSATDTISRPDTMVQGTIINPLGNEVGVNVNGVVAFVYGNQFVANHVPLEEGENTITASAVDTEGNTATVSITVYAETTGDYIRLEADTDSGISPLEVTLSIESSFDFTVAPSISYTGPGDVEYLDSCDDNECDVRMATEGFYFFTAEVANEGNTYFDSVAVLVLDQLVLDSLLRAKWNGMRQGLAQNDIDSAVKYFSQFSKENYREMFTILSHSLIQIAQELDDIQFIQMMKNSVEYDIRITRDGDEYSFYLLFVKDEDGLWKIRSF